MVELGPNDVHCCVGREGSRSSSGLRVTAEDGWGSGGGQGAGDGGNRVKRRVAQLDDRLELVECRGKGMMECMCVQREEGGSKSGSSCPGHSSQKVSAVYAPFKRVICCHGVQ